MKRLQKFSKDNNAWVELDDEKLYDEYQNKLMSFNQIGKKYGINGGTVKRHIEYYAKKNNLPLELRDEHFYLIKTYPRIIKIGTDSKGNDRYCLKYKSQNLKESVDYNKLEKILNDPKLLEELYEEVIYRKNNKEKILQEIIERNEHIEKNNIKYFRVGKRKEPKSRTGFYWTYVFSENKKRKTLASIDIKELEKKVKEKGWVWKEIKEVEKPKKIKKPLTKEEISLNISKQVNTTGIYHVRRLNRKDVGILWLYEYKENDKRLNFSSVNLNNLKEKVLYKNLPWIILDESKAAQSFRLNDSFNTTSRNFRQQFTLWDTTKIKYRKSVFKKNDGLYPMGCFSLKFNNKQVSCGTFNEFLSPTIIYDFIKENLE